MQTNLTNKYDISKIINGDFDRKIWKMDTSHFSILKKFLTNSKSNQISIEFKSDNRYAFINPLFIKNEFDPGYAENTISQYLRILIFYNVIDFNEIIKFECKTWRCVVQMAIDGKLQLNDFDTSPEEFLIKNIKQISQNISLQINSENSLIRKNAITILSTMETFLNYKNSDYSDDFSIKGFNSFLNQYEYEVEKMNVHGSDEGYIDELRNWMKMYDFCEELLSILLGEEKEEKELDDLFGDIDFTGLGYLGEYIIDKYLEKNGQNYKWVSREQKFASYDFQLNDEFLEVKTPSTKKNKISFNLSWNEYIEHQQKKDKYKIYYVDGVYNLNLKEIIKKGISNIDNLMKEGNIKISILSYNEIRDYRFSSKGYWVTEK